MYIYIYIYIYTYTHVNTTMQSTLVLADRVFLQTATDFCLKCLIFFGLATFGLDGINGSTGISVVIKPSFISATQQPDGSFVSC